MDGRIFSSEFTPEEPTSESGRYVVSTISNRPVPCILDAMEDVREAAGFALVTLAVVATVVLLLVIVLI